MRVRRWLVVLLVGLVASGSTVAAADLEDDLAELARRIDEIESAAAAAGSERSELVATLVQARDELAVLVTELNGARAQVQVARDARAAQRDQLAELNRSLNLAVLRLEASEATMVSARAEAEQLARNRYMGSGFGRRGGFVISAETVTDVEAQLAYLDRIAAVSEAVLSRFDALRSYQETQRDRITSQEEEAGASLLALRGIARDLVAARSEVEGRTDAVEVVVARQEATLHELNDELSHFTKELDKLAGEQHRLEDLIEDEQSGGGSTPNGLVRPVPGRVTSTFGPRTHPILGTVRLHTGIDMSAPYGQPIKAAAGGRVILASSYGGYGNTVMIDHGGGMVTLYAHQSRIRVSYGEIVTAGQTVGESGSTGLSTGPHLHFEVRINGTPVNPLNHL